MIDLRAIRERNEERKKPYLIGWWEFEAESVVVDIDALLTEIERLRFDIATTRVFLGLTLRPGTDDTQYLSDAEATLRYADKLTNENVQHVITWAYREQLRNEAARAELDGRHDLAETLRRIADRKS